MSYLTKITDTTKQRDLSRSIQLDAQEMARRADYVLGKVIRDGQDNGTVATPKTARSTSTGEVVPVTTLANSSELYGGSVPHGGILALADHALGAKLS